MTEKRVRNIAASVRQRLLNRARERGEDFQLLLTRYAVERLLYRLSRSKYAGDFVLKGATFFTLWGGGPYRATRDLDLLGTGESDISYLEGHLSFEELMDILVKNRAQIGQSLSGGTFGARLQRGYENSLEKLLPIKERLARTDWLIDQIVYRLYGLTEEEIKMVEGEQRPGVKAPG